MKNKLFTLQASIFLSAFSTFHLSISSVNAALLVIWPLELTIPFTTVGFDLDDNFGTILRYDGTTGEPLPSPGNTGPVFVATDERLVRPIGITYTPENLTPVPEPVSTLGLLVFGAFWTVARLKRDRKSAER